MSRWANSCREGILGGVAGAKIWRWEGLSVLDAGEAEVQWAKGDELKEVRGVGTGQILQTNDPLGLKLRFYWKNGGCQ